MTNKTSPRKAQSQFGQQAHFYAKSAVHRGDESLTSIERYASIQSYDSAVDIGTGTGFTAFAISPYSKNVVGLDVSKNMLNEARELAKKYRVRNLHLILAEAERLPFKNESIDIITSRQAAHHFHNIPQAIKEVNRVIKDGATFILADTIAPENDAVATWMNDVELRRDPSHQKNLKISEWMNILEYHNLHVTDRSMGKVHLEFDDWVERSGTKNKQIRSLWNDFISASKSVVDAFGIKVNGDAIEFHWDVAVFKIKKRLTSTT